MLQTWTCVATTRCYKHSKFDAILLYGYRETESKCFCTQYSTFISDDLYHTKVSAPVTHHWKELRSSNLRHSVPL